MRDDIRGDRIGWLDESRSRRRRNASLLAALEALRGAVNRELMLGLWRFEGHYALYPPGARYARHRDRFRDDDARVLSCVLYLNEAGARTTAARCASPRAGATARDVLPDGGTLVAFLAAEFEHEVLPATRPRLAVTGWFRTADVPCFQRLARHS